MISQDPMDKAKLDLSIAKAKLDLSIAQRLLEIADAPYVRKSERPINGEMYRFDTLFHFTDADEMASNNKIKNKAIELVRECEERIRALESQQDGQQ